MRIMGRMGGEGVPARFMSCVHTYVWLNDDIKVFWISFCPIFHERLKNRGNLRVHEAMAKSSENDGLVTDDGMA